MAAEKADMRADRLASAIVARLVATEGESIYNVAREVLIAEFDVETRVFWKSPSGRIHGMRLCSGGCTPLNSTKVNLTATDLAASNRCRCARWQEPRPPVR